MFNRIISAVIFLVCIQTINAAIVNTSPWEHTSDEVGTAAPTVIPGSAPLIYSGSTFSRERELYGYYPRYKPNMVTFDYNNRPYIYVGKETGEVPADNTFRIPKYEFFDDCYIQTIDDNGQWVVIDFKEISAAIPGNEAYTDFNFYTGDFSNVNRVAFDSNGYIYFTAVEQPMLNTTAASFIRRVWGGSVNDLENWSYTQLYNGSYFFEVPDTFTSDFDVPSLIGNSSSQMKLYPVTNAGGSLSANSAGILIGDRIQPAPMQTGTVNAAVTLGNYVHIVYLDLDNLIGVDETAQYYVRYNKLTNEFSTPVFLGSTVGLPNEGSPDTHNGPVITVSKDRTLHVVLGAHGTTMKYVYSTDNGDSWSTATDILNDATYPSICTTPDDTIHMVYRKNSSINDEYKYRLWYAKKELGQPWEDVGCLVEPYKIGYSVYYHKLTTDRLGNLYLSYSYLILDFTSEEITEHEAKWPAEDPATAIYSHDRSLLTSNDGGASWHLATTADFVNNITSLTAYYSFDNSSALAADYSGNGNNLQNNYAQLPDYTANGAVDGAAVFNGIDDGFDLRISDSNPSIYPDGSFTISMWAKPTLTDTFVSVSRPSSNDGGFCIYIDNGTYRVATYGGSGGGFNTGVAALGSWAHISLVFQADGDAVNGVYTGTLSCYINGELKGSASADYNPVVFRFGLANRAGGTEHFTGLLDEVAVFKGALDQSKIISLANKTATPATVLLPLTLSGDMDSNGIVNSADLVDFLQNWLVTE
ncbi:MAG: LamG-like jellyroll fold domain-containing protein [Sedimentisphaeraceae bacterium JB056]